MAKDRVIYGATSGDRAHLFSAMIHGATGAVFDLGVVPGVSDVRDVVQFGDYLIAAAVSGSTTMIVRNRPAAYPPDLIQEWSFNRHPIEMVASIEESRPLRLHTTPHGSLLLVGEHGIYGLWPTADAAGESPRMETGDFATSILGVASAGGNLYVSVCDGTVCEIDQVSGQFERAVEITHPGTTVRLTATNDFGLIGITGDGFVIRVDPESLEAERLAEIDLPPTSDGIGRAHV